ncbi:hypothetical protein ACQRIT_004815 [Beauveria bassiana]
MGSKNGLFSATSVFWSAWLIVPAALMAALTHLLSVLFRGTPGDGEIRQSQRPSVLGPGGWRIEIFEDWVSVLSHSCISDVAPIASPDAEAA